MQMPYEAPGFCRLPLPFPSGDSPMPCLAQALPVSEEDVAAAEESKVRLLLVVDHLSELTVLVA